MKGKIPDLPGGVAPCKQRLMLSVYLPIPIQHLTQYRTTLPVISLCPKKKAFYFIFLSSLAHRYFQPARGALLLHLPLATKILAPTHNYSQA